MSSEFCSARPAAWAPTTCSSPREASSNGPVELAARLSRDRARVVDIGKTRLDLPWNDYYEKELDVRFSRSYGPGRYDDRYELDGIDYPAGYVRWTERRNLGCFLDLIARDSLDVTAPGLRHPIRYRRRTPVYEQLRTGTLHGVGFLLEYPKQQVSAQSDTRPAERTVHASAAVRSPTAGRHDGRHRACRFRRRGQLRHHRCCCRTW